MSAVKRCSEQGQIPTSSTKAGDLTLFWSIDGGIEIIKLMHQYGVNMDTR